ncbi:glycosyltransferase family 1 protein [Sphingomonas naphthae]|uniref:Glycosyltransferase family 1 protein n=1 Tax=Sphingomonas naphthae TaxID=1813468 RepID=A0ABY7TSL0_9SPHN|nr:glycosyltransferase family 1 protein [Sphingomonas naphthae]WCT74859.1 glycosyltransferase family 1 protein [Sphingomonas naphthae]
MLEIRPRGSIDGAEVVLDISRLLSRALHAMPTGVDRCEMAYATDLIERIPDRLSFSALHPAGAYGRLSWPAVRQFLSSTGARWRHGGKIDPLTLKVSALRHWTALWPKPVPAARRPRVYLQASPHHLERGDKVRAILRRENAAFVCLVHDVIPIVHPEYAREDGAMKHLARIRSVADHAAGIVSNSAATEEALIPFLQAVGHRPELRIAHLGVDVPDMIDARKGGDAPGIDGPYFVCVATIEPRKNHLLLLNIWRRLIERHGHAAPKLVLIGRRGWENEQIVDMLDRCATLKGHVIEYGGLPDRQMRSLMAGARALLLPSFAEGFGMPVTEALIARVPVIASDLGALMEAGGAAADYLDPLDGFGWMDAILDYAKPDSARRAAQLERIRDWRPPSWRAHLDTVMELVDAVAERPAMA